VVRGLGGEGGVALNSVNQFEFPGLAGSGWSAFISGVAAADVQSYPSWLGSPLPSTHFLLSQRNTAITITLW